jgi:hypothetical protein
MLDAYNLYVKETGAIMIFDNRMGYLSITGVPVRKISIAPQHR